MTTVEKKVDAIARMLLGITDEERNNARRDLCVMLDAPPQNNRDREAIIHEILKDIGIPCHNLGYGYLVEAIMMVMDGPAYVNNIFYGLYPQLAIRFDTTASRVERAIRHSIELGWSRGDRDVLAKYFGNTVSPEKGKPTNSEFIAQIANVVRMRMKQ